MKLKPNTYYKRYYIFKETDYDIIYTRTKWGYIIMAVKYVGKPLVKVKYDKKFNIGTVEELQHDIDFYSVKVEEISESDVFLELL